MADLFTWVPLVNPTGTFAYRLRKAQFGDGYKQRVGDGPNGRAQQWPFQWIGSNAEMKALTDFLDAHATVPFLFTAPGEPQQKFTCDGFTRTAIDRYTTQISATFEQDFTP